MGMLKEERRMGERATVALQVSTHRPEAGRAADGSAGQELEEICLFYSCSCRAFWRGPCPRAWGLHPSHVAIAWWGAVQMGVIMGILGLALRMHVFLSMCARAAMRVRDWSTRY